MGIRRSYPSSMQLHNRIDIANLVRYWIWNGGSGPSPAKDRTWGEYSSTTWGTAGAHIWDWMRRH